VGTCVRSRGAFRCARRASGLGVLLLALAGCRATTRYAAGELEGSTSLGVRSQPSDWEDSTAPLIHADLSFLPESWPVAPALSADLTGWFGSQEGEQTASFGLGVRRTLELVDDTLWTALGLGRMFLDTETGDLFDSESDAWQASYVEGGLYVRLGDPSMRLGLELRYLAGDGPEVGGEELDGELFDVFVVLAFYPTSVTEGELGR
jgi:hypothetical protein